MAICIKGHGHGHGELGYTFSYENLICNSIQLSFSPSYNGRNTKAEAIHMFYILYDLYDTESMNNNIVVNKCIMRVISDSSRR